MVRVVALVLLFIAVTATQAMGPVKKIKVHMVTKSIKDGYMNKVEADIYYSTDGRMITYFAFPDKYISITNSKGDIQMYDEEKNEVYQSQNIALSSETSQIYFFLQNKTSDLGLTSMGFQMSNTSFDEGLTVTEWRPPVELSGQVGKVKLVHDRQLPIFMSYFDINDAVAKKIYFYNYTNLNGTDFPMAVTQINYLNASDSTITKTTYSDIAINQQVDENKINFVIPANAKVIK